MHVDGAFGLWAAAEPSLAHLTTGVEQADSWATTDADVERSLSAMLRIAEKYRSDRLPTSITAQQFTNVG